LRGRVLPIGGVREKVLAAHRAGLKTVVLPEKNMKDLVDLPKTAKSELKIIPVHHMDEVLQIALASKPIIEPPRPRKQSKEEGQDEGE
jgi:ATP-dependent Lon protease